MPLVAVDEDLQWRNAPTLSAQLSIALQLLHRGVRLAYDNALLDGRAAAHGGHLSRLLVQTCTVFGLHRPSGLFLDHLADVFVIFP